MDLIDEQDRTFSVHSLQFLSLFHHFFHVLFTGYRGIDLPEFRAGGIGNDLRQRRLAGAGRSVENNGADLVCFDGAVQQLILTDDVFLPYDLIQCPGTHSRRQRSLFFHIGASHIFK